MAEPLIEVEHATRIYRVGDDDLYALRDLSLTIERREFVAIVGSSGSGKSTLMAVLGCLDQLTTGRYRFDGVDTAQLGESELAALRSERLGFVFQNFNLLARTSAIENVALPLFYGGGRLMRRTARLDRARKALAGLGLARRERNTPGRLSGGEQQRVAIARALINEPSVLLADEPTGNLDTRTSHEIMETLRVLNRERGLTVVVVTHEADIADYADRVVTMRDGAIVSDERRRTPPAEPKAPPARMATPEISLGSVSFAEMIAAAALQALARNKMRSALTMLGVFIGVAALIVMVSVGQGANAAMRKQLESLGTNLLVVLPGATATGGARGGFGSASTLTIGDAEAIGREAPAAGAVGYLIRQSAQVQYGGQNWTTLVLGVSPNYPPLTNWQVVEGRAIGEADERSAAAVAVLGQTAYRQLFPTGENPIGAIVQMRRVPVRVIGLFAAKGQTPFGMDQDDVVMIPFSAAERKVLGVAAPSAASTPINWPYPPPPNPYGLQERLVGYVNQIFVQAARPQMVQAAVTQVTNLLARRHRIGATDIADFSVHNLGQIATAAEASSRIMALLLAAVASISLVVGGIGIMNILLVSVTERTREIGLRMAIGARRLQVLLQFLAEAVLLSVTGGIAGILAGLVLSQGLAILSKWPMPVSPTAIAGGFVFSAAVGIFFGFYPARKAAHLNPIEALRYE
jgi:macrolide transport system ATP-binding/permease protein